MPEESDPRTPPHDGSGPAAHYPLTVREVVRETAEACAIVLEPLPEHAGRFSYRPGQFLTLRVGQPDSLVGRCYSLASSPHADRELRIAVKRTKDGYASNWICDNVRVGDQIDCLAPAGVFTPRSLDEDLLLWAGGSGITPIMSILKSALHSGSGRIVLIYANADQHSVIFAEELRQLAVENPSRLIVMHWLESVQGLPSRPQLHALAEAFKDYTSFVCGPGPFMDAVTHSLRELEVPRSRIHVELFQSLAEDPFVLAATPVAPADDDGSPQRTATVEVRLDGQTHNFEWPAQTKLLDLLLEKGLDAPFSCRQGACSACACQVVDGEVKMITNEILDQSDLDDGYILACQSLPVSDAVTVTYDA